MTDNILKKIMILIGVLWGVLLLLYFGANIIFPFIFSFFTSLVLLPIANTFEKWGLNKLFSALIIVLFMTSTFIVISYFVGTESYSLVENFTESDKNKETSDAINILDATTERISKNLNISNNQVKSGIKSVLTSSKGILIYILDSLKGMLAFLSIIPIYVFFMLYYRSNLIHFFKSIPTSESNKTKVNVIRKIKKMTQKYLQGLFIVVLIVSILNTLSLFAFGLDYALFIGLITGLMTIIPYIGIFFGALIPIVLAIVTKDGMFYPIGIFVSYLFIQFIEGNFITPKIVGESINLNPLVIILGMIVFGAVGGIIGMIVCIPCLASFKIVLDHSSRYKHFSILMSHKIK